MAKFLLACVLALLPVAAAAEDPLLDRRVQALAEVLRCLVCQNQSLADSHADLAMDLKHQVREKLKQGESERDVIAYMVERYGDFILYRPPVKAATLLLWTGPALLLAGGIGALFLRLRRRDGTAADAELSMEERARAAAWLDARAEVKQR